MQLGVTELRLGKTIKMYQIAKIMHISNSLPQKSWSIVKRDASETVLRIVKTWQKQQGAEN